MEKDERRKKLKTHYTTLRAYIVGNCIMHVISYNLACSSLPKLDRCSVAYCDCQKVNTGTKVVSCGNLCQINEIIIAMQLTVLLILNRYFEAD